MTSDRQATRDVQNFKHDGLEPLLSVVAPGYNEEAVLRETHTPRIALLEQLEGLAFEIVYVDDGSRDATLIYAEVKRRPLYLVQGRFGFGAQLAEQVELHDSMLLEARDELARRS